MRVIFLYLVLDSFSYQGVIGFDWRNTVPWKKDLTREEFKKRITLRLVRKDWMPTGSGLPEGDEITPHFAGSVKDAYGMFLDKETMYESYEMPLENARELLTEDNGFNPELESIFVIHTISGDAENYFVKNMMIVFALRNFIKKYNIFAFNMPTLQDSMEQTIFGSAFGLNANYKGLGGALGDFFNEAIKKNLMKLNQIHLLGFCYSSQLAGHIARYISSKNDKQKIKSITGLDPYSAGLSGIRYKVLSKKDAEVVYVFHSNSILLGTLYRKATVDFHLNSGFYQPGCFSSGNPKCSHRRAVTAFWYMILYPDFWLARKCPDWLLFKTCLCNWNSTVQPTFPPTPGPKGHYFFNTMSNKPYGYGPSGANCYTWKQSTKPEAQSHSNDNRGVTIEFDKIKKQF